MKFITSFVLLLSTLSSFGSSFDGEYEQSEGSSCYIKLTCEEKKCEAYLEKEGVILKIKGNLYKDSEKKFNFLRRYTGVYDRWYGEDEYSAFDELTIKKLKNGTYKAVGSIQKFNLFPFAPSMESTKIECKKLNKIK